MQSLRPTVAESSTSARCCTRSPRPPEGSAHPLCQGEGSGRAGPGAVEASEKGDA